MKAEKIVIDVNVFMNAMSIEPRKQGESGLQQECRAFLDRVHVAHRRGEVEQWQPPLFILELFATMNRQKQNHSFDLYGPFKTDPLPFKSEPFTDEDAYELQRDHVLYFDSVPFTKAGDLVYLAVARKHKATLVTGDDSLLKYGDEIQPHGARFATVVRPSAWRPELASEVVDANASEGS